MSLEKIIKEALDKNPLEMKDAFAEEMQSRIAAALEEKYKSAMEEDLEEAKDDDDEDEDDDDDDDDDSDDDKIGADMKKLNASCSKTEMYGKMREKYGCSKGKFEGLYASYCESISEAELDDMIDNMSEETLASFMEEIEQLDELSPDMLTKYRARAKGDITSRDAKTKQQVARGNWDSLPNGRANRNDKKNVDRQHMRQLAKGKLQKHDALGFYNKFDSRSHTKKIR